MGKIYKNGVQYSGTVGAATNINYDNTLSPALSSTNVQAAIDELVSVSAKEQVLTQAEYDALPSSKYTDGIAYYITDADPLSAETISYDNTDSGLAAEDVQNAIDEIGADVTELNSVKDDAIDRGFLSKNLLNSTLQTMVSNGVTCINNGDGTYTLNGTPTTGIGFIITDYLVLPKGKYILTSEMASPNYSSRIEIIDRNASTYTAIAYDYSGDHTHSEFELTEAKIVKVFLYMNTNYGTATNVIVKPMIRDASIADSTYMSYAPSNNEVTKIITNPNLLDNSWFTVNQRGQSSYTSGYSVDRWYIAYNPDNINVNVTNGLQLASNGVTEKTYLCHYFEENNFNLVGKTVTLSVLLSDGRILTGSSVFPSKNSNDVWVYKNDEIDILLYLQYSSASKNLPCVGLGIGSSSIKIRAIKLELGSVSTLHMDTVPNYQQELAKCQRYFQAFGGDLGRAIAYNANSVYFALKLTVPLRTSPTLSLKDTTAANAPLIKNYVSGSSLKTGFTYTIGYNASGAIVVINATLNAHGITDGDLYAGTNGNQFYLSADL